MRVYVGVDWSATEVVCATATDELEPRGIAPSERSEAGVVDLMNRIRARHEDVEEIHVFIETGAPGWVKLFHLAGAIVHVVDAKQAKAFGASLRSSKAKDDARDAKTHCEMGRSRWRKLPVWSPPSAWVMRLRALASLHEARGQDRIAELQRLRARLREHFPELECELGDLTRKWVHRVLEVVPTPYHASRLSREDFDRAMSGCGARKTTLETVWQAIEPVQGAWMDEEVAQIHAEIIQLHLDEVERLSEQLKELEARLDDATVDHEARPLLESVGGIGVKMSNRLLELAFGEEVPEHRDAASIKLGASPVFEGSGKTSEGEPKGNVTMRRSASPRGRATCYLLGRLASQQLPWAKARYAWDKQHGKKAATSYRAIARSLLRILTAILKSGEPYDDERYTAILKRKGVPWAQAL